MNPVDERQIDAALARLPEWEPPPGFAARVAAQAAGEMQHGRWGWLPLALRGSAVAACVSVGAWLGAEVLAGLVSSVPQVEGTLAWVLAGAVLVVVWRLVSPMRVGRINS
jgi:hypothetical protein